MNPLCHCCILEVMWRMKQMSFSEAVWKGYETKPHFWLATTSIWSDHTMLFHLGSERVISLCLPLYLGDEMRDEKTDPPYLELFITITVQPPCITIHPPQILFTPAPLEISAAATVTLLALGYPRSVYTDTVPIAHLWMPPLIILFMTHELLS